MPIAAMIVAPARWRSSGDGVTPPTLTALESDAGAGLVGMEEFSPI